MNSGGVSEVKVGYINNHISGNKILDVGAGQCYYSKFLLQQNKNLDIHAIDHLDLNDVAGFNYIKTDLEENIPFPDETFNTVLAFDIIEHIKDVDKLISNLYRVCKKGGVLIGSVPHDNDSFLPKYNLTFYHRSDLTHVRYYVPETLKAELSRFGFNTKVLNLHGGVSPQVIAEFFPKKLQFVIKKTVGLLRRIGLINTSVLKTDIFFVAVK